jgi:hypothetical protein
MFAVCSWLRSIDPRARITDRRRGVVEAGHVRPFTWAVRKRSSSSGDRAARHRAWLGTRTRAVACRACVRLVAQPPPAPHPLGTRRQHAPRAPEPRMRTHLLATPPAVTAATLPRCSVASNEARRPRCSSTDAGAMREPIARLRTPACRPYRSSPPLRSARPLSWRCRSVEERPKRSVSLHAGRQAARRASGADCVALMCSLSTVSRILPAAVGVGETAADHVTNVRL